MLGDFRVVITMFLDRRNENGLHVEIPLIRSMGISHPDVQEISLRMRDTLGLRLPESLDQETGMCPDSIVGSPR